MRALIILSLLLFSCDTSLTSGRREQREYQARRWAEIHNASFNPLRVDFPEGTVSGHNPSCAHPDSRYSYSKCMVAYIVNGITYHSELLCDEDGCEEHIIKCEH